MLLPAPHIETERTEELVRRILPYFPYFMHFYRMVEMINIDPQITLHFGLEEETRKKLVSEFVPNHGYLLGYGGDIPLHALVRISSVGIFNYELFEPRTYCYTYRDLTPENYRRFFARFNASTNRDRLKSFSQLENEMGDYLTEFLKVLVVD